MDRFYDAVVLAVPSSIIAVLLTTCSFEFVAECQFDYKFQNVLYHFTFLYRLRSKRHLGTTFQSSVCLTARPFAHPPVRLSVSYTFWVVMLFMK